MTRTSQGRFTTPVWDGDLAARERRHRHRCPRSLVEFQASQWTRPHRALRCLTWTITWLCLTPTRQAPDRRVIFVGHLSSSYYIKPCFSPDGAHIACGSLDHNVHIWNVARPREKSVQLSGHALGVNVVHWSSRADALASCSDDGATRVWSVNPYKTPPPRQRAMARTPPRSAMNARIRLALGDAEEFEDVASTPTKLARASRNASAQSTPGAVSSPCDPTPEKPPPQKLRKRVREPFTTLDVNAGDR